VRVGQGLALFGGERLGDAAHVLAHQRLQLQHDAGACRDRRVLPGLERGLCRSHRRVDLRIRRERHLRQHLLRRRIYHVVPLGRLRLDELAIEQHFDSRRLRFNCHDCAGHENSPSD
jgi:hypothetical protein